MANFHSRSNSLPSQSHPIMRSVEDQLCTLKSSETASTSASSVCKNLANLKDLHEGINNLIEMPSIQQALSQERGQDWMNQLLEGSLGLVDLCGLSRDIACLIKESVQDLKSSIRRNKADSTAVNGDAYVASRKKISKTANKCLKNLKSFNGYSGAIPDKDYDLKAIGTLLRETESLDLSVLKSVLVLLSWEKKSQRSWSLLSKLTQKSRVHSEAEQEISAQDLCCLNMIKSRKSMDAATVKNILKQSQMTIRELEDELESLFRSLLKTRVSLPNLLSH